MKKLLPFILICIIFYSCSRTNPNPSNNPSALVGKWDVTETIRYVIDSNTVPPTTGNDTTFFLNRKGGIFTFNADNTYTAVYYIFNSTSPDTVSLGTYSIVGDSVFTVGGGGYTGTSDKFKFTITGDSLVINYVEDSIRITTVGTTFYVKE